MLTCRTLVPSGMRPPSYFIHRQTLYNRLEKLEELMGPGYMDQGRRICLEMALLAHAMIENGQWQSS
ncbi:helix-turn-helix domain-containing protein [Paenibacillus sp. W4I10]|uniref:helix-turn-helix domain-containing protein n=1 Tax=Paenibacillus sp. W4I10 TaxID=3042298 RepID=UPI00358E780C